MGALFWYSIVMARNTPYRGEWPTLENIPAKVHGAMTPPEVREHLRSEFPDCLTPDLFPAFLLWAWDTKPYSEPDAEGMIETDESLLLRTDGDKFLEAHVGPFNSLTHFRDHHVQQYGADPKSYADEIIRHDHHIYPLPTGELLFVWKG